ncbi:MAG: AzlD domain-containing protein [Desulfovibrionales bacterium]|nr:AzlD domain-containing protein [Desulfovibrionales bacterium]
MPESSYFIIFFTIICMAAVTYFTRVAGLLIVSRINPSPRLRSFLDHMPSSILVAIIVPSLADKGPAELSAAVLSALTAILTRNLIASLLSGLIAVSLLRYFIFT